MRGFVVTPLVLYLGAGAVILASVGGIYWSVSSSAFDRGYTKAKAECEEAARIQREAEIGKANLAATEKEKGDAKAKVVYRTITRTVDKIVDRPVYVRQCFDADGVSIANAALAGTPPATPEPDSRVPQPLPIIGRDRGGSAP